MNGSFGVGPARGSAWRPLDHSRRFSMQLLQIRVDFGAAPEAKPQKPQAKLRSRKPVPLQPREDRREVGALVDAHRRIRPSVYKFVIPMSNPHQTAAPA